MKLHYDVKGLDLRFINLNLAITSIVGPQVEEDIHKFSLTKSSTIRAFILYRLLCFIIDCIKDAARNKLKIIFYINPALTIENLQQYSSYFNVCIRKLSKCLVLSLYVDSVDVSEIIDLVADLSGEGKEIRARISLISDRIHKRVDLSKLDKMLMRSGITQVHTDFLDSYKVKLGLYTT